MDDQTATVGAGLQVNRWYHVAMTYNDSANSVVFYVDGVAVTDNGGTAESVSLPSTASTPLKIGGELFSGEDFDGIMDEVRIYNRALSATEIAKLAQSGAVKLNTSSADLTNGSTLEKGLVGHWTFDGGDTSWTALTVATTSDRSGNGNHGGMQNMNRRTSVDGGKLGQAFNFDGADDLVIVQDSASLDISTAITIGGWVYSRLPVGEEHFARILEKPHTSCTTPYVMYMLGYNGTNKASFELGIGGSLVQLDGNSAVSSKHVAPFCWHI